MNWTLAVTGGALVVMVGRSVRSHAASESPCLLPPMAVLPVAPVLLLRAGRLHPAMVPMGFAAAIILCLRAILPDSEGVDRSEVGLSVDWSVWCWVLQRVYGGC